jgi:L-alanine-DL-glutamate epimerase-like enolase superfamily enzyme
VAPLCEAALLRLSAHTSPALHLHPCLAVRPLGPLEYFHDHARIEQLLFDGAPEPVDGRLVPDLDRAGLGLELREADADRYRI